MVIPKGCARCGGDIDAADEEDIRCVQCGHRPALPIAALRRQARLAARGESLKTIDADAALGMDGRIDGATHAAPHDARENFGYDEDTASGESCPRCDETDSIALEKLRPHFNTCYRCRLCGHIFSPAAFRKAS